MKQKVKSPLATCSVNARSKTGSELNKELLTTTQDSLHEISHVGSFFNALGAQDSLITDIFRMSDSNWCREFWGGGHPPGHPPVAIQLSPETSNKSAVNNKSIMLSHVEGAREPFRKSQQAKHFISSPNTSWRPDLGNKSVIFSPSQQPKRSLRMSKKPKRKIIFPPRTPQHRSTIDKESVKCSPIRVSKRQSRRFQRSLNKSFIVPKGPLRRSQVQKHGIVSSPGNSRKFGLDKPSAVFSPIPKPKRPVTRSQVTRLKKNNDSFRKFNESLRRIKGPLRRSQVKRQGIISSQQSRLETPLEIVSGIHQNKGPTTRSQVSLLMSNELFIMPKGSLIRSKVQNQGIISSSDSTQKIELNSASVSFSRIPKPKGPVTRSQMKRNKHNDSFRKFNESLRRIKGPLRRSQVKRQGIVSSQQPRLDKQSPSVILNGMFQHKSPLRMFQGYKRKCTEEGSRRMKDQMEDGNTRGTNPPMSHFMKQMNLNSTQKQEATRNQFEGTFSATERRKTFPLEKQTKAQVPKVFICLICYKAFSTKGHMREHKRSHTWSATSFPCIICKKPFDSQGRSKDHEYTHMNWIELQETDVFHQQCFFCNDHQIFLDSNEFEQHIMMHAMKSKSRSNLKLPTPKRAETRLLRPKRAETKLPSPKLSKQVPQESGSEENGKICLRPRRFECLECNKVFAQSGRLKAHEQRHIQESKLEKTKESWKHECPTCHKKFKFPYLLKTHSVTHSEEKPFKCSQCDKSYTQKSTMVQHEKLKHY